MSSTRQPFRGPLTTIEKTLRFLQSKYSEFGHLDDVTKESVVAKNTEVVLRDQSFNVPLRTLYIDLTMHDTMIQHSQDSNDKNEARIRVLIQNKIAIQKTIFEREQAKEVIVPDTQVVQVVTTSPSREEMLNIFLSWCPEKHRHKLSTRFNKIWTSNAEWPMGYVQEIQKAFIIQGLRSVEDFRVLVTIVECLMITGMMMPGPVTASSE
jgi:hypothetical protein